MTAEERARLIERLGDQELDLSYRDSVLVISDLRRVDLLEKALRKIAEIPDKADPYDMASNAECEMLKVAKLALGDA